MTFVLKEFEELKTEFNDTLRVYLKSKTKERIDELENPRRSEIQFLRDVLESLASSTSIKTEYQKVSTFYGAMLLVQKDIKDNMRSTDSNGLLYDRLNVTMGINGSAHLESQQKASCYKSLSEFLSCIYVNKDPRQGLNLDHPLKNMHIERLIEFTKKNYELELTSRKYALEQIKVENKDTTEVRFAALEASFSEQITWNKLKSDLHNLELDELATKNVADITKLSNERAAQLAFLKQVSNSLEEKSGLDNEEKTAIMLGAIYLVRGQIAQKYSKEATSANPIEQSFIHKSLTNIVDAQNTSIDDMQALIHASNRYLHFLTMNISKAGGNEHLCLKEKNTFSGINGFDLVALLKLSQTMIRDARVKALNRCFELHKQEDKATNSNNSTGWSLRMFNLLNDPAKKDEEPAVAAELTEDDVSEVNSNI